MKTENKQHIPKRPAFTQENFVKIFNELEKLQNFLILLHKMPFIKRALNTKKLIRKFLNSSK